MLVFHLCNQFLFGTYGWIHQLSKAGSYRWWYLNSKNSVFSSFINLILGISTPQSYPPPLESEEEKNENKDINSWYIDMVIEDVIDDLMEKYNYSEQMAAILYRYSEYKGDDISQRADTSVYPDAGKISNSLIPRYRRYWRRNSSMTETSRRINRVSRLSARR